MTTCPITDNDKTIRLMKVANEDSSPLAKEFTTIRGRFPIG